MKTIKTFRSKNELVYDALRTAILQGDLQPGQRLVIDDLASQLGVSQIPIREALRQLEADGFISFEPYIGATVSPIEASSITEIFGLLETMEIISGRAACERLTDEDIAELEQMLRHMDTLADDLTAWSQANVRFHQFICERSGTTLVKKLMERTLDHWDRLRSFYLTDVFALRIGKAQEDHWRMFEAIRSRDPQQLEAIVSQHNRAALAAYLQHIEKD